MAIKGSGSNHFTPQQHHSYKSRNKQHNGSSQRPAKKEAPTAYSRSVSSQQTHIVHIPQSSRRHQQLNKKLRKIEVDTRTTLNRTKPLSELMNLKPGGGLTDTNPHFVMVPTTDGLSAGISPSDWHVKKPGKISSLQSFKRYLKSLLMKFVGKTHKANYFENDRTLVEKEILAGKIHQLVHINGPTFAKSDWELAENMEYGYFKDEDGEDCIASKHIDHDYMATKENASELYYDGEHNPATAYVLRRYLTGDEDAVKRANYLVKISSDTGFQKRHCFVSIDHGYAFYNISKQVTKMSFREFAAWSLEPPLSHKLHYRFIKPKESIMPLINGMSPDDRDKAVYMALAKIAVVTEKDIEKLCCQISDIDEREKTIKGLKERTRQAIRMKEEAEQTSLAVQTLVKNG